MSLNAIEKARKRRQERASDKALVEKDIKSRQELKQSIDGLSELLTEQEQLDLTPFVEQLKKIANQSELATVLKSLEKSLKDFSPHKSSFDKIKIDGFSGLLKAIKGIKPQVHIKSMDVSAEYKASDAEVISGNRYFGFLHPTGKWYILRQTGANGGIFRYASGAKNYVEAWSDKSKQKYKLYNEITL